MNCRYNIEKDIYIFNGKISNFWCNSKGESIDSYTADIPFKTIKNAKKSKTIPKAATEAAIEYFDEKRGSSEWEKSDEFKDALRIALENDTYGD